MYGVCRIYLPFEILMYENYRDHPPSMYANELYASVGETISLVDLIRALFHFRVFFVRETS